MPLNLKINNKHRVAAQQSSHKLQIPIKNKIYKKTPTRHNDTIVKMNQLTEKPITCPYCGEIIKLLIDCSEPEQSYIEDCQVCCRPIEVKVIIDET